MENKTKSKKDNVTIIDGKNLILGRLGSVIAKRLLLGESIKIINCKEIVILGRKKYLIEKYKNKLKNKVIKQGPYYSRSPADLVKRSLRNMVPYKKLRGIEALKKLKCYNSVPSTLLSSKKETVDAAKIDENSIFYYTEMGVLSKHLGYEKLK